MAVEKVTCIMCALSIITQCYTFPNSRRSDTAIIPKIIPADMHSVGVIEVVDPLENIGVHLSSGYLVEGDIHRPDADLSPPRLQQAGAVAGGYAYRYGAIPAMPPAIVSHQARNSVPIPEQTWTDRIVPYEFDVTFNTSEIAQIQLAFTEIMEGSESCLSFVPRQQESDFLYITGRGQGCYSGVGRKGGNQSVQVASASNCVTKGIIMHELLHALGFWHEHTRRDRDSYIIVLNDHIKLEHIKDFKVKQDGNLLNLTYDYYSIMHYTTTTFSKNPYTDKTIEILNSTIRQDEVGQRKYLSPTDKMRIRKLYNCPLTKCVYPHTFGNDGNVVVRNTTVGSIAKYSCSATDHILIGAPERTCLYDGMWSGSTPICFNRNTAWYCNFEDPGLCGWSQDTTDEADWTRYSSHTPSELTGPLVDHTKQTTDGFYVYLEGSHLPVGYKARLISPLYQGGPDMCILFWYNMFGVGMGNMTVYMTTSDGDRTQLWTKSGNQNTGWKMDLIPDINSSVPFQIIFEATRGPFDTTDMAIDDVIIGSCQNITNYENAVIRELKSDNYYFCDFDTDLCGWSQNASDHLQWHRQKGPTASLYTGPDCDITDCQNVMVATDAVYQCYTLSTLKNQKALSVRVGTYVPGSSVSNLHYGALSAPTGRKRFGSYVYLEASNSRGAGDAARMVSPNFQAVGDVCIKFGYHMFGSDIGNLTVSLLTTNISSTIWSKSGDLRKVWRTAHVQIYLTSDFKIAIEASSTLGFRGDIAVDDVSVTHSRCAAVIHCDFDQHSLCELSNDQSSDDFDWVIMKGHTHSTKTGPTVDHTTGSGYYAYIEASAPQSPGDTARLVTPYIQSSSLGYCVTFWYFMYGQDVASCKVILSYYNTEKEMWKRSGDIGQTWLEAKVQIPAVDFKFQVILEAEVGATYLSDIAIDDIVVSEGACS